AGERAHVRRGRRCGGGEGDRRGCEGEAPGRGSVLRRSARDPRGSVRPYVASLDAHRGRAAGRARPSREEGDGGSEEVAANESRGIAEGPAPAGEGSSARTRTERRLRRLLSSTRVLTPPPRTPALPLFRETR